MLFSTSTKATLQRFGHFKGLLGAYCHLLITEREIYSQQGSFAIEFCERHSDTRRTQVLITGLFQYWICSNLYFCLKIETAKQISLQIPICLPLRSVWIFNKACIPFQCEIFQLFFSFFSYVIFNSRI